MKSDRESKIKTRQVKAAQNNFYNNIRPKTPDTHFTIKDLPIFLALSNYRRSKSVRGMPQSKIVDNQELTQNLDKIVQTHKTVDFRSNVSNICKPILDKGFLEEELNRNQNISEYFNDLMRIYNEELGHKLLYEKINLCNEYNPLEGDQTQKRKFHKYESKYSELFSDLVKGQNLDTNNMTDNTKSTMAAMAKEVKEKLQKEEFQEKYNEVQKLATATKLKLEKRTMDKHSRSSWEVKLVGEKTRKASQYIKYPDQPLTQSYISDNKTGNKNWVSNNKRVKDIHLVRYLQDNVDNDSYKERCKSCEILQIQSKPKTDRITGNDRNNSVQNVIQNQRSVSNQNTVVIKSEFDPPFMNYKHKMKVDTTKQQRGKYSDYWKKTVVAHKNVLARQNFFGGGDGGVSQWQNGQFLKNQKFGQRKSIKLDGVNKNVFSATDNSMISKRLNENDQNAIVEDSHVNHNVFEAIKAKAKLKTLSPRTGRYKNHDKDLIKNWHWIDYNSVRSKIKGDRNSKENEEQKNFGMCNFDMSNHNNYYIPKSNLRNRMNPKLKKYSDSSNWCIIDQQATTNETNGTISEDENPINQLLDKVHYDANTNTGKVKVIDKILSKKHLAENVKKINLVVDSNSKQQKRQTDVAKIGNYEACDDYFKSDLLIGTIDEVEEIEKENAKEKKKLFGVKTRFKKKLGGVE